MPEYPEGLGENERPFDPHDEHQTTPHQVVGVGSSNAEEEARQKGSKVAVDEVLEMMDNLEQYVKEAVKTIESPPANGNYANDDSLETMRSLWRLLGKTRNNFVIVIERWLDNLGSSPEYRPYPPSEKQKYVFTTATVNADRARLEATGDAGAKALELMDKLPDRAVVAATALTMSLDNGECPKEQVLETLASLWKRMNDVQKTQH